MVLRLCFRQKRKNKGKPEARPSVLLVRSCSPYRRDLRGRSEVFLPWLPAINDLAEALDKSYVTEERKIR